MDYFSRKSLSKYLMNKKCVRQTFDGRKKERRRIITRYDTVFEIKW
jgi:hypothetical protein